MRLLRVAPARQTVLDLGPDLPVPVAAERGWWRLPEPARVEVIALLARLIARGVLVEVTTDHPSTGQVVIKPPGTPTTGPAARSVESFTGTGAGSGETGE